MLKRTVLVLAAALAFAPRAAAQTMTWVGAVNGSWSNANNWSPAVVPSSSNNLTLQFFTGSTTAMTDDIAGTLTLNKMNIPAGAQTFTLTGNTLNFSASSSLVSPSIVMNSGSAFSISDALTLTNNLTISGAGTGTLTLSGQISGASSLMYDGAGTLALGSFVGNLFTGGITVNSGTLKLAGPSGVPANGNVTVANGATFNTNGLSNGTSTSSLVAIGAVTLNGGTFRVPSGSGDFWLNQLNMAGGALDFTGSSGYRLHFKNAGAGITVDGNSTVTGGGNASIQNETTSALPVTITGGGNPWTAGIAFSGSGGNANFTFSGGSVRVASTGNTANMTFTSDLYTNDLSTDVGSGAFGTLGTGIISAKRLFYDGPSATSAKPFTLNGPGQINFLNGGVGLTLTGVINQAAAGTSLSVFGHPSDPNPDTLTLTGANAYSGATIVDFNGVLAVPTIANGGVVSPIGFSSNAQFNLQLGNNSRGTLLLTGMNASYSTDRGTTVSGVYTSSAGGAIGVQNAGTTLTISGQITGPGSFIKTGAGTLVLTNAANDYASGTYVEAGTLTMGSPTAIPNAGNVTVSGGATFDIGSAGNFPAALGTVTLNGGTLRAATLTDYFYVNQLVTGTTGGTIDATGSTSLGSLHFTNPGAGITVNGNSTWTGPSSFYIANDSGGEMPITIAPYVTVTSAVGLASDNSRAANSFRVTGGGTLYLTKAQPQIAYVRVNQARLRMDDLTNVTPGVFDITLDNGTLQYGGPTASASAFTVGAGGGTLEIFNAATTLTLTGALPGGVGRLTKTGPGTLSLTNAGNSFNGLTVNAGVVQTANDNTLGFGSVIVNGGTLRYTATTASARSFYLNSGALDVASGATLTLNGATVNGGFLRGAGTYAVTGGTMLSGATTLNSTTVSMTGAATIQNFSNGGSLSIAASLASPTTFDGFTNQRSGSLVIGAVSKLNVADFQTYGTLNLNPAVVGSGQSTELVNTGASPLYFNGGSRTFIGTPQTATQNGQPTFVAGIDLNGKNAVVASGLFVNNGFVADSSPAGTATIIADFGSLIKGAGFFQNPVITQNGGKFQAGNSPGSASFGKFVLGPGGVNNYVFAIDDATGKAGPSPDDNGRVSGWGLVRAITPPVTHGGLNESGDFTWTATPGDKLTVAIDTLINPTTVGTDIAGPMADFDPTRSYSWLAAEWAGAYRGPADAAFLNAATSFDTSGFVNPIAGTFGWSLDATDHALSLTYTPTAVPEPGTLAMTAAGLALAGYFRRPRKSIVRG